jgi:hypothetical protein
MAGVPAKSIVIAPPRIRTSSNSKVFGYKRVKFWPERGLIHIVEEDTGEYTPCSRSEWVARIVALNNATKRIKYRDERTKNYRLIEQMLAANKEAKDQGDPFDPRVGRDMMDRGPTSVSMTGTAKRATPGLILPGSPGFGK